MTDIIRDVPREGGREGNCPTNNLEICSLKMKKERMKREREVPDSQLPWIKSNPFIGVFFNNS